MLNWVSMQLKHLAEDTSPWIRQQSTQVCHLRSAWQLRLLLTGTTKDMCSSVKHQAATFEAMRCVQLFVWVEDWHLSQELEDTQRQKVHQVKTAPSSITWAAASSAGKQAFWKSSRPQICAAHASFDRWIFCHFNFKLLCLFNPWCNIFTTIKSPLSHLIAKQRPSSFRGVEAFTHNVLI